jgi:hypothetical protein
VPTGNKHPVGRNLFIFSQSKQRSSITFEELPTHRAMVLVCDRMDITGARWRLDCAEAVLRLRALRASDDFDAYWQFHKLQEFKRNHLARFQEPERFFNG